MIFPNAARGEMKALFPANASHVLPNESMETQGEGPSIQPRIILEQILYISNSTSLQIKKNLSKWYAGSNSRATVVK